MDIKVVFGIVSSVVAGVSFIPYLVSILKGEVRPHFFTWIVWSILLIIITLIQFQGNAGPGFWGMAVTTITTIFIAVYSWFFGERSGSFFDWVCFLFSLIAIPVWLFVEDPTVAACLASVIDLVAFWPTVSKSWRDPYSENLIYYIAWLVKYPAAYFALTTLNVANAIYPVLWTFVGVAFVGFLIYRRRAVDINCKVS
ncbi:MAG: hypothetical protein V4469_03440 [Patescibacteria group bacterium]